MKSDTVARYLGNSSEVAIGLATPAPHRRQTTRTHTAHLEYLNS